MNNLLQYLLLVAFTAFFFCLDASPQNPNDFAKMTEVLTAPPNAAALGKYGGIDVSLNSGMMTKSISLYTIKSSQLEVPLSIVYNSSGFKVSEPPSRLGMGWTMNIGGVI